jgi:hypothetical protein
MKARLSKITVILTLISLFIMAGPQNHAIAGDWDATVEEIVERYIEAIGGREAIEKLTTRVCIGTEITDLTSREKPIYESLPFEAYTKTHRKFYFETWSDTEIYRRGYDGKDSWIKDKCGVRHSDYVGKDRVAWLLNPHNALMIEEYFPNLEVKDTARVRGMIVYTLESPEFHRPLFFDTKTGLLVGFGHNWEIHDYREVDGVLFPHRVHMSRKGGSTVYEFTEVRHNEAIDDSLFTMPAE